MTPYDPPMTPDTLQDMIFIGLETILESGNRTVRLIEDQHFAVICKDIQEACKERRDPVKLRKQPHKSTSVNPVSSRTNSPKLLPDLVRAAPFERYRYH